MLDDVLQCLLRDAVERDLHVLGQPAVVGGHGDRQLGDRAGQGGQRVGESEVLEDGRPQAGQRGVRLEQRQVGQFPCAVQFASRRLGVAGDRVRRRVEVVGKADEPLRDAVVDVAREPPPFGLLGRDDLLGEAFCGLFARGQAPVQAGLVDRPGDKLADRHQQADVPLGEVPAGAGVHVKHADEPAGAAFHRHRHHGRVAAPAEFGKVAVARVGLLFVGDHHGLPVGGYPAAHPLAEGEPDLPGAAVERRRGPGQRQGAAAVVEYVHEADVGAGGPGDELRDAGGEWLERRPGRDRLDDPGEKRVLPFGVGQPEAGCHWKTPSRSAAATAAARSPTPSLR